MISIKTLYDDMGKAVQGICKRVYPRNRPKSLDSRLDSYIVVSFPSFIYNNEIDDKGSYNDYSTIAQIEIYIRDKNDAKNPNLINISDVDKAVKAVMERFPISTDNILVTSPQITLQTDDGNGFSVTIIQGKLRTK